MTRAAGEAMLAEIREQPAILERVLAQRAQATAVASMLRRRVPAMILFAARGTSDNAAAYCRYITEVDAALPTGLMAPSTMTVYGARPDLSRAVVIVVSQSGGSPDLCAVAETSRRQGALVVAVTNNADSPLALAADAHIDVLAGPELAVAATKSYTAQLLTLRLLVDALSGRETHGLQWIADAAYAVAERETEWRDAARHFADARHLVVTGRGYSMATSHEAALKIMETSYLPAQSFSAADLLHGPMAMVGEGTHALAVVPDSVMAASMAPVVERLAGATTHLVVAGGKSVDRMPGAHLRIAHGLPESLSPIVDIMPLQFLAWQMAVDRGHDPDAPRGLSKVTRTL